MNAIVGGGGAGEGELGSRVFAFQGAQQEDVFLNDTPCEKQSADFGLMVFFFFFCGGGRRSLEYDWTRTA